MDEQLIEALRSAIRDSIQTSNFDTRQQVSLAAGRAGPELEQEFAECVADALERRLVRCGLRHGPTARALLN